MDAKEMILLVVAFVIMLIAMFVMNVAIDELFQTPFDVLNIGS